MVVKTRLAKLLTCIWSSGLAARLARGAIPSFRALHRAWRRRVIIDPCLCGYRLDLESLDLESVPFRKGTYILAIIPRHRTMSRYSPSSPCRAPLGHTLESPTRPDKALSVDQPNTFLASCPWRRRPRLSLLVLVAVWAIPPSSHYISGRRRSSLFSSHSCHDNVSPDADRVLVSLRCLAG